MLEHKPWPHAPSHFFVEQGTYMVTAATYKKEKIFRSDEDLYLLQNYLFELAIKYGWNLEAWAIFPNHYHFIAQSPKNPENLNTFMRHFHSVTAIKINAKHGTKGKQVWYQYRDSKIDFQKSYLARLNYVTNNPVKHGIVLRAEFYPWCSAHWFFQNASPAYYKTVMSFKTDGLNISDDF